METWVERSVVLHEKAHQMLRRHEHSLCASLPGEARCLVVRACPEAAQAAQELLVVLVKLVVSVARTVPVGTGIQAVLPQSLLVLFVVGLPEHLLERRIHVRAVLRTSALTVGNERLRRVESLLQVVARAVFVGLQTCLCQHSQGRFLCRDCRRGVRTLVEPLCGELQIRNDHIFIYGQRLGARGREVHRFRRFGYHRHGSELLYGVEIVDCTHEPGFCQSLVTLGFRGERSLSCQRNGEVAAADTIVDVVPIV